MGDVGPGFSARRQLTKSKTHAVPVQNKRLQNVEHGLAVRDKMRIINYIQAKPRRRSSTDGPTSPISPEFESLAETLLIDAARAIEAGHLVNEDLQETSDQQVENIQTPGFSARKSGFSARNPSSGLSTQNLDPVVGSGISAKETPEKSLPNSTSKPVGFSARNPSTGFSARHISSSVKSSPPTASPQEASEKTSKMSSSQQVGFSARNLPLSSKTSSIRAGSASPSIGDRASPSSVHNDDEISEETPNTSSSQQVGFSARNLPQTSSIRARALSTGSDSPSIGDRASPSLAPSDDVKAESPQTPAMNVALVDGPVPCTPQQDTAFRFTAKSNESPEVSNKPGVSTKPSPLRSNRAKMQAATRKDWFNSKRQGLTSPTLSDSSQSSDKPSPDGKDPKQNASTDSKEENPRAPTPMVGSDAKAPPPGLTTSPEDSHVPGVKPRTRNLSSPSKLGTTSTTTLSASDIIPARDLRRTLSNPGSRDTYTQLAPNDLRLKLQQQRSNSGGVIQSSQPAYSNSAYPGSGETTTVQLAPNDLRQKLSRPKCVDTSRLSHSYFKQLESQQRSSDSKCPDTVRLSHSDLKQLDLQRRLSDPKSLDTVRLSHSDLKQLRQRSNSGGNSTRSSKELKWQLTNSGVSLAEIPHVTSKISSPFGFSTRNPPPGFITRKPPPGLGTAADQTTTSGIGAKVKSPPGFEKAIDTATSSPVPSVATSTATTNSAKMTTPPGFAAKVTVPPGFGSRARTPPPGFEPGTTPPSSTTQPKPNSQPTVSVTPDLTLTEEQKNWRQRSMNPLVAPPGKLQEPLDTVLSGAPVKSYDAVPATRQHLNPYIQKPSTLYIPKNQQNLTPHVNPAYESITVKAELYSVRKSHSVVDHTIPTQLQQLETAIREMKPDPEMLDEDHELEVEQAMMKKKENDEDDDDDESSTPVKVSVATWRAISVSHTMLSSNSRVHFSFGVANLCELLDKYGKEMDQFNKKGMDRVFRTIRNIILDHSKKISIRMQLLQVLEMRANKWKRREIKVGGAVSIAEEEDNNNNNQRKMYQGSPSQMYPTANKTNPNIHSSPRQSRSLSDSDTNNLQREFHGIKIECPPEMKDKSISERETTNPLRHGVTITRPPADKEQTTPSVDTTHARPSFVRSYSDGETTYARRKFHGIPIVRPPPEKEQTRSDGAPNTKSQTAEGPRYSREFLLSCYDSPLSKKIPINLHFTFINSDAGYIVERNDEDPRDLIKLTALPPTLISNCTQHFRPQFTTTPREKRLSSWPGPAVGVSSSPSTPGILGEAPKFTTGRLGEASKVTTDRSVSHANIADSTNVSSTAASAKQPSSGEGDSVVIPPAKVSSSSSSSSSGTAEVKKTSQRLLGKAFGCVLSTVPEHSRSSASNSELWR